MKTWTPVQNRIRHVLVVSALMPFAFILSCSSKTKSADMQPSESAKSAGTIPPPMSFLEGDIKNGESIAKNGTPSGAAACSACHGQHGEGMAASGFPRLANQFRLYAAEQLQAYATGVRANPVMMPIAKALSPQDIADVTAYFEQIQKPSFAKASTSNAAALKRGALLANFGDEKIRLQACANCHGPSGIGEGPRIPYLAGQYAGYLEAQLLAWKHGERNTNPEHMGFISKEMSEKDMKLVALYFNQVTNSQGKR